MAGHCIRADASLQQKIPFGAVARIASAGLNGRIDTTSGPANGPAGAHGTLVRYIGTLQPCSM
jgi:hypothetical protein